MVKSIIHFGNDGFGHQLHGFFTCMVLHEVNDYYFDGHNYLNNNYDHQNNNH